MENLERQLKRAIRRYWPCAKKSSTIALTDEEFKLKLDNIMSCLSIQTEAMRRLVFDRLSMQWVRMPALELEKAGYRRTFPKVKQTKRVMTPAYDDFVAMCAKRAQSDGYQMFRKDESEKLKWKQVR